MTDYGAGTIVLYETGEVFILDEDRSWVRMFHSGIYELDSVIEDVVKCGNATVLYDSVGGLDKMGVGAVMQLDYDLYVKRESGKWYDGVNEYTDKDLWALVNDFGGEWSRVL